MAEIPNVCLSLASKPENVVVVRQALTGLADTLALDAIETNDLNTAVSEACNNVVMHAYAGGEGPLEVDVYALADGIAVVVRDHGSGIRRREHDDHDDGDEQEGQAGIGLPVISALSRTVRFTDLAGGGTEVRMEFAAPNMTTLEPLASPREVRGGTPRSVDGELSNTLELRLAPSALARAVLPRVLSTVAARAHFSTDRISDVQLLADTLASNAGESISGSYLCVSVAIAPRRLELRIGPVRAGRGEGLLATGADGFAAVIERLTDAARVARADSAETLELRVLDRP